MSLVSDRGSITFDACQKLMRELTFKQNFKILPIVSHFKGIF